jgi:hypothetical protein
MILLLYKEVVTGYGEQAVAKLADELNEKALNGTM